MTICRKIKNVSAQWVKKSRINTQNLDGFTLAELLIALAILGVIATFTIPKVLNSSQDESWNSIAKETAAMMSGAYQAYLLNNTVTTTSLLSELTPFMNYVRIDTTTTVDHYYGHASPTRECSDASFVCFKLHNGAMLRMSLLSSTIFCNPNTRARWFQVDPDGRVTDTTPTPTGNGKAVAFYLYENGRITDRENMINPSCGAAPVPNVTPPWFSW